MSLRASMTLPVGSRYATATGGLKLVMVGGVGFFFSGSSSSKFFCLNSGNWSGAVLPQPFSVPIWAWSTETRKEYLVSDIPSEQALRETWTATTASVCESLAWSIQDVLVISGSTSEDSSGMGV